MRVAVASLRFAPGHVAHLRAYRELFLDLGCEVGLFLDQGYDGFIDSAENVYFINGISDILEWKPDSILSYNIANENITLARQCRKKEIKFFYVLHEPWFGLKDTLALGRRMPRRIAANVVNYLTSHYACKVILASENGKQNYLTHMKHCNKCYAVFPLIFCDDYDTSKDLERKYFSFIGGFTEPRACSAYLDFVRHALSNNLDYRFCIATRNPIDGYLTDAVLQNAIKERKLVVFAGRPMTSEEINQHYREAICTWNAYKMSTQSGVLPNALMQGTPVLVTDRGDSAGIISDKREGCFVSLPHENKEIQQAFEYISKHVDEMSRAARDTFHKDYEYKVYLNKAKEVYEIK